MGRDQGAGTGDSAMCMGNASTGNYNYYDYYYYDYYYYWTEHRRKVDRYADAQMGAIVLRMCQPAGPRRHGTGRRPQTQTPVF